jgi:hypothetical protein
MHHPGLGHCQDAPFCSRRHPSPSTFASETFELLCSHFSSTNSANHFLSSAGLTNLIEAMSSDHPDPYLLFTQFAH